MIVKTYLTQTQKDYWEQYGSLSIVVNKLLEEVDIQNLPKVEMSTDEKQIKVLIDVTNEDYLAMRDVFGARSNNCSIGRILRYYMEIDYPNEAGWEKSKTVEDMQFVRMSSKYTTCINELKKLEFIAPESERLAIQKAMAIILSSYKGAQDEFKKT